MLMKKRDKMAPVRQTVPEFRGPLSTRDKKQGAGSSTTAIYPKDTGSTKEAERKGLDWDDISLSSEDSKSFQRFLKKSGNEEEDDGPQKVEKKSSSARPKTSRGEADRPETAKFSSSSALSRLAAIEAKIKTRLGPQSVNKLSLSGSDFDLDVSSDMDVKKDIGKTNVKLREKMKKGKESKPSKSQSIFLTLNDSSETSEEGSVSRKRFIKNQVESDASQDSDSQESIRHVQDRKKISKIESTKPKKQVKATASMDFDESEASIQAYMTSSNKDAQRSGSSKKVTFASDLVRSSDLEQSLDDFMPPSSHSDDPSSLDEILPTSIHNVMSLDDLLPSEEVKFDDEDDQRPTSALGFVGLHSVEELLPAGHDVRSSSEYVPSMEEEIGASDTSLDKSSSYRAANVLTSLRSIDDLQKSESDQELPVFGKLSSTPKANTKPKASVFKAQEPVEESEVSEEIKSESPKYSEDFHSDGEDDDTLKDTDSITQDISEDAQTVSSVTSERSRSSISNQSSSTYSTFSSSPSSSTITTRTPAPVTRKSQKKTATIETQTDATTKPWIPGMSFVDSAYFKPTRLVQGEILDVLSAQNPAAIALQDLLKQQLALTREFIAKARLLHDRAVDSIPCDYVYGQIDEAGIKRLKNIWYKDYEKHDPDLAS